METGKEIEIEKSQEPNPEEIVESECAIVGCHWPRRWVVCGAALATLRCGDSKHIQSLPCGRLGVLVGGGWWDKKRRDDNRGSPAMRRMMLHVEEMRRGGCDHVIVL